MPADLIFVEAPSPEDRAAILKGLVEFNRGAAPAAPVSPIAILIKDDAGQTVGGLWSNIAYDWLAVELVFVPEALRGHKIGTQLIARAETAARERGCLGVWLDTFSFQARGFYEKLGYSVFGQIDDHPVGGARYFLRKRLS